VLEEYVTEIPMKTPMPSIGSRMLHQLVEGGLGSDGGPGTVTSPEGSGGRTRGARLKRLEAIDCVIFMFSVVLTNLEI
jgi:hypothetical protein